MAGSDMSAVPNEGKKLQSGSDEINSEMKKRRGVVRGRTPKA
jgi:hypothetical protein